MLSGQNKLAKVNSKEALYNMKELDYFKQAEQIMERLAHGGVFLTVGGERPNTMTIGWGAVSYVWNKPVFLALVRPQRFTHALLEKADSFTVSVPTLHPLREALAYAGSVSGRDENKFDGHGLTAVPALKVPAPIVAECGLHLECKILLRQPMTAAQMDGQLAASVYPAADFHEMYFGQVLACYTTDE